MEAEPGRVKKTFDKGTCWCLTPLQSKEDFLIETWVTDPCEAFLPVQLEAVLPGQLEAVV